MVGCQEGIHCPPVRLGLDSFIEFHQKHGKNMYLHKTCDHVLNTGQKATKVYIFPKYKLHFVFERAADMHFVRKLALAKSQSDIYRGIVEHQLLVSDLRKDLGFPIGNGLANSMFSEEVAQGSQEVRRDEEDGQNPNRVVYGGR